MDERLKGRTILIGKEPGQGRLVVSVSGVSKVGTIGAIGSVPNSVSRWKDGTAHCQIAIGQDGCLTIKNLKEANKTYVNGAAVVSKRIDGNSRVELGMDHYSINVNMVLQAVSKLLPVQSVQKPVQQPPQPTTPVKKYSIRHLNRIWEDYTNNVKKITIRQRNINLLSSIPMAFSMLGGLVTGVVPDELKSYSLAFTAIALAIFIYGLYRRFTDKSLEEREELNKRFKKDYVCPNCHKYQEGREYALLLEDGKCRKCGCIFVE